MRTTPCILLLSLILSCNQGTNKPATVTEGESPIALRSDIKIEHVMIIGPKAVRLTQNPVTGDLWYINFDGDVFEIKDISGKQPAAQKIFSAADHGITKLQGMAFLENTLFLCGNYLTNNGKSNIGRMVRYDLQEPVPEMTIVFNTAAYGTNKTTFDHGWNALAISPDEKYIYVNSGSRTDHGEVQDSDGTWPNARDGALTAKIFRFPVETKNLLLTDDESKLKAGGYIYAEGIRNAFSMAFNSGGELFAVVNSGDYDHPEDMFWIRQGHHYGFPWVMGGIENPQQHPDWHPDPAKDPFLNPISHAWQMRYFHNDPGFPKKPPGVKFSPGIKNLGPDANEYRDQVTGKITDGDKTRKAITTFTPHSSPVGLVFDTKNFLSKDLKGDGFVLRYSYATMPESLLEPFTAEGADLLHLDLSYDKASDSYHVRITRIAGGFKDPSDCIMVGNTLYLIEYNEFGNGNIWKITLL